MKIIYKAIDGKDFGSRDLCAKYEITNLFTNKNEYFTNDGEKIIHVETIMRQFSQNVKYIKVINVNDLKIIHSHIGSIVPTKQGCWKWSFDGIGGCWVECPEQEIDSLSKKNAIIKKIDNEEFYIRQSLQTIADHSRKIQYSQSNIKQLQFELGNI